MRSKLDYHQLFSKIDQLLNSKEQVIVTIDGMSGAGKSSLAALLNEAYDCNVISLDSFFLRSEQRVPERFAEIGGNIDYERFFDEVHSPLRAGTSFEYRPFDCRTMELNNPTKVEPRPLTILEGVYSMHPYFTRGSNAIASNNISVFLKIDETEQRDRLIKRNPFLYDRFINEWIPMEKAYFEHFKIEKQCDFVFATETK
ncbi:MAG: uridine kinase [Oscillospiraceae bacterium]|nr:uridine kinase [Oscillospiraceae bacterium]